MNERRLQELVRYRMEQANETLREAEVPLTADAYRGCVSRAYYAMFYAVLALLATRDLGTSKHAGAIALFDREFVRTEVFPPLLSKMLHMAFDLRQSQDYGELLLPDYESAQRPLPMRGRFSTRSQAISAPRERSDRDAANSRSAIRLAPRARRPR